MSIDYLFDLERDVDNGKELFACPGVGNGQWVIGSKVEEIRKTAKRTADNRRTPVNIVKLIPKSDAVTGDLYLVPRNISEPGARGEPQIQWAQFETKDAAETMRDIKRGPSPYFGTQIVETIAAAE